MLKKLNSVLKNPALRSAFRAVVFSLALVLFGNSRSFGAFFLFIAVAFYFYLKPFFEAKKYFFSFLIFLVVALLAMSRLPAGIVKWNFVAAAVFGLAFFAFLGIKNLVFISRALIYEFLNNFIFFSVFVVFFVSDKSSGWIFLGYAAAVSAFFPLFRESIIMRSGRSERPERYNLFSASLTALTSQFILAVSYLPIGFLNSAAISLAAVLVLKDLAASHLRGDLNRFVILKNATIILIFSVIVFMASKWQP